MNSRLDGRWPRNLPPQVWIRCPYTYLQSAQADFVAARHPGAVSTAGPPRGVHAPSPAHSRGQGWGREKIDRGVATLYDAGTALLFPLITARQRAIFPS